MDMDIDKLEEKQKKILEVEQESVFQLEKKKKEYEVELEKMRIERTERIKPLWDEIKRIEKEIREVEKPFDDKENEIIHKKHIAISSLSNIETSQRYLNRIKNARLVLKYVSEGYTLYSVPSHQFGKRRIGKIIQVGTSAKSNFHGWYCIKKLFADKKAIWIETDLSKNPRKVAKWNDGWIITLRKGSQEGFTEVVIDADEGQKIEDVKL